MYIIRVFFIRRNEVDMSNKDKKKEHKMKDHKMKEHKKKEHKKKEHKNKEYKKKEYKKKEHINKEYKKKEDIRKEEKHNKKDLLEGIFTAHERGFGFVTVEGREQDIFIPSDRIGGAFPGDKVEIKLLSEKQETGKRLEGKVVNVVERGVLRLVGYFERNKKFGFVRPDNVKFNKDIFVPLERSKGAITGHKVVVEILNYGGEKKKPEGKVVEIIGHVNDPGTDILSIIKDQDLPMEFSERVLEQGARVGKQVSDGDINGRKDIRDWKMVTIDGEDAKDLDDAISLIKKEKYFYLGVHIADVTNYVQEKSALDREALKRGTSVYLVDRVIPMLPHVLSNGICSLNAGEDRLALSCIMKIGYDGQVLDYEIAETVIHVDARMTYTEVKDIIGHVNGEEKEKKDEHINDEISKDDDFVKEIDFEKLMDKYKDFISMFLNMEELAQILRTKRFSRGAIDFDFPESKMVLDSEGVPIEIKAYDRNVATKIIEEFMLLANETVSKHYATNDLPFVYRIHEEPDIERVKTLATFIQKFGHSMYINEEKVSPKDLQKLLDKIEGKTEADLISRLMLRTMKQAKYTDKNTGHFGLAAPYYSHFTSPIRRYPDLQIHRIIKDDLRKRLNGKRQEHYRTILPKVTGNCSDLERRAETAERETIKLKKAEYMEQRIGEEFNGIISSLTKWGMYVELENTIEGLVHVTSMTDDHYEYIEDNMEMVGESKGSVYKLGQAIKVKVKGVDKLMRTIDFSISK